MGPPGCLVPSGLGVQNPCFGKLLDPLIPEAGYIGLTVNSFKVRYGIHKTSFKYNEKESTPASLGLCGASRMVTTITTIESPPWRPDLTATPPTILQVALDGKTHQQGKYINMHRQDLATINRKDVFLTSCLHNESKFWTTLLLDFHFGTEFST